MSRYAEGTEVPIGRSRDEIERTLTRFGATAQAWMRDDEQGVVTVAFKRGGQAYRFTVPVPRFEEFTSYERQLKYGVQRHERTETQARTLRDSEERRRFRSLANYVKAVMDATESGIIRAEEALLPYMMLSEGETVYQRATRQIKAGAQVDLAKALLQRNPRETETVEGTAREVQS